MSAMRHLLHRLGQGGIAQVGTAAHQASLLGNPRVIAFDSSGNATTLPVLNTLSTAFFRVKAQARCELHYAAEPRNELFVLMHAGIKHSV
ncbi:hypothetical protein D3C78_56740 [compost metagenome]